MRADAGQNPEEQGQKTEKAPADASGADAQGDSLPRALAAEAAAELAGTAAEEGLSALLGAALQLLDGV